MAQNKTAGKAGGKGRTSKRSTKKAAASRTGRTAATSGTCLSDDEIAIDRRRSDERRSDESANQSRKAAPQLERRKKVNRRRQIDPTTCERDYTDDEVEFMNALDEYKRQSGRMFPTCSEVLEVVRGLGYAKMTPGEMAAMGEACVSASSAKPMPAGWSASVQSDQSSGEDGPNLHREEAALVL